MADSLARFEETRTTERWANDGLSPANAAMAAHGLLGSPIFILVHTPKEARFLRLTEDGVAANEEQAPFNLDQAFEIRLFSDKGEISWRRTGASAGRAVLTRDEEKEAPGSAWFRLERPAFRRGGERLLWGRLDGPLPNGWSQLSSPRIGPISVPIAPDGKEEGAVLKVVEYARQAVDGNVISAGERLAGFGWVER